MKNDQITIRPAVKKDCPAIITLVKELATYERAPDEVTVSLEHFAESGFGVKPVWWAFVAVNATREVVGFALYYIRFSTWKGQRMYLEDLLVTETWRGKGIGSLLMDALINAAKDQQFSGISWQVLNWNEPAIKFYKRYEASFDGEWMNVSLSVNHQNTQ